MIFGGNKVECPRCLGKGVVEKEDIIRLDRVLHWAPDSCAYCQGQGKVSTEMVEMVPPGLSYLSTNLPFYEREALIKGDPAAWERAEYDELVAQLYIDEIIFLHRHDLSNEQIVSFFQLRSSLSPQEESREELEVYVQRVIEHLTV